MKLINTDEAAILISIKPRWCAKIFRGEKNVELRKTYPLRIATPFHAYVYCTLPDQTVFDVMKKGDLDYFGESYQGDTIIFKKDKYPTGGFGEVPKTIIGEIVIDKILEVDWDKERGALVNGRLVVPEDNIRTCVTVDEFLKYKGKGNVFGWHILECSRYKKPMTLQDYGIKRPPQSWCYIF